MNYFLIVCRNLLRLLVFHTVVGSSVVSADTFCAENRESDRVALVIGVNDYINTRSLSNAVADAQSVGGKLCELGFTVELETNLTTTKFKAAIDSFQTTAKHKDVAVVYYAGHGIQVPNGVDVTNYLVPSDGKLEKLSDAGKMIDQNDLEYAVSESKWGVIFLDACRNNPMMARFRTGPGIEWRDDASGLSNRKKSYEDNVITMYSTRSGALASDDGHFAKALVENLGKPIDIRFTLGAITKSVFVLSDGFQRPVYQSPLMSEDSYVLTSSPEQGAVLVNVVAPSYSTSLDVIDLDSGKILRPFQGSGTAFRLYQDRRYAAILGITEISEFVDYEWETASDDDKKIDICEKRDCSGLSLYFEIDGSGISNGDGKIGIPKSISADSFQLVDAKSYQYGEQKLLIVEFVKGNFGWKSANFAHFFASQEVDHRVMDECPDALCNLYSGVIGGWMDSLSTSMCNNGTMVYQSLIRDEPIGQIGAIRYNSDTQHFEHLRLPDNFEISCRSTADTSVDNWMKELKWREKFLASVESGTRKVGEIEFVEQRQLFELEDIFDGRTLYAAANIYNDGKYRIWQGAFFANENFVVHQNIGGKTASIWLLPDKSVSWVKRERLEYGERGWLASNFLYDPGVEYNYGPEDHNWLELSQYWRDLTLIYVPEPAYQVEFSFSFDSIAGETTELKKALKGLPRQGVLDLAERICSFRHCEECGLEVEEASDDNLRQFAELIDSLAGSADWRSNQGSACAQWF